MKLETGKTYSITTKHRIENTFVLKVDSICEENITGLIVYGRAKQMIGHDYIRGEKTLVFRDDIIRVEESKMKLTTIKLKDGEVCHHNHSDRMVQLSKKYLMEYFSDGDIKKPGNLEDDFTGQWSIQLTPWKLCPFYPALALLVDEGHIIWDRDETGDIRYALKGDNRLRIKQEIER